MAKFCTFFSGSTGNCTYISSQGNSVLVDAGASLKSITENATLCGIDINEIDAVFITHRHADHIKGLIPLIKKTKTPVYASSQTLEDLIAAGQIPAGAEMIPIDTAAEVAGIRVCRFPTSHDCAGSSGFAFNLPDGNKISVCTDLGIVTDDVRNALYGSNLLLIESNHDLKMLKNGPYPPELKLRIMSDKGHLSNNACAAELPKMLESGTTRFILGHLSRHNNLPSLARNAAKDAFAGLLAKENDDYILEVAPPSAGRVFYL